MKTLFKVLFILLVSGIFVSSAFAAKINFSTPQKTSGTTDDIFQIYLSVDGQIDGGQIGIEGLENFVIIGQQSSSQIQIVNGKATSVRQKIFSIQPKKSGNFVLTALAHENGKKIKSSSLSFSITKSLLQSTKENLLKSSVDNTQKNTESSSIAAAEKKETKEGQNTPIKDILKNPQKSNESSLQNLQYPTPKNFPKVQHISAFNMLFWGEFFGLLLLFILLLTKVFTVFKRKTV